jgi:hypothetical protein
LYVLHFLSRTDNEIITDVPESEDQDEQIPEINQFLFWQVNLFDTIQTSLKIVYTSVFVTLTAFIDNVLSLIWRLKNEQ